MFNHPDQFAAHYAQQRHELNYIKSLVRSLHPQQRKAMTEYYRQSKSMDKESFFRILDEQKQRQRKRPRAKYLTQGAGVLNDDDDNESIFSMGSVETSLSEILDLD